MISERTFLEKVTDSLTIYHLSWFTNTAWCWHCHIIENRHKWKRDDVNILLHKQAPAEKMLKLHSAYVIIKCVSDVFSRPCLFQCTKELTRMMLHAYNLTLLIYCVEWGVKLYSLTHWWLWETCHVFSFIWRCVGSSCVWLVSAERSVFWRHCGRCHWVESALWQHSSSHDE